MHDEWMYIFRYVLNDEWIYAMAPGMSVDKNGVGTHSKNSHFKTASNSF